MATTIRELCESNIPMGHMSNTGFHMSKGLCCNDYKDRFGIKYEANEIGVSCFNCGIKARYTEGDEHISKKMREVLNIYGVANEDIDRSLGSLFFENNKDTKDGVREVFTLAKITGNDSASRLLTPEISLPAGSYRLDASKVDDMWQEIASTYLELRCLTPTKYQYWLSSDPRYRNRIIIPYLRQGRTIYWQARAVDDSEPRYLNSPNPKDPIVFGYDELTRWSELPLFVFEGVLDALTVNGIALLGSAVNETKIEILKRSKRRLVFVIDPDHNGRAFANTALNNGWEITFPPDGIEDVNKSVCDFGKVWTVKCLMDNIVGPSFAAELKLNLWCGS